MQLDHRRILATALGRLRGKLKYRPVVFELLPPTFTLLQLQRLVEALAGVRLHKQNFRRAWSSAPAWWRAPGQLDAETGGRPAELFRFRREVLRERPRPGVGTPWTRVLSLTLWCRSTAFCDIPGRTFDRARSNSAAFARDSTSNRRDMSSTTTGRDGPVLAHCGSSTSIATVGVQRLVAARRAGVPAAAW